MSLIKPQTLKGFRDFLPGAALARERLLETARAVYRSYGYSPIDTPALEYAEILLGKGGEESDKQVFRFLDAGERDVAMRFDLTVPFARFAAQHLPQIGIPFKRYHMGTVWRGENTGRGRFREFMQCDFDTIGTESNVADVETLLVIHDLFDKLGIERFTIRVNNRMILNGLLDSLGLPDKTAPVLRALDKIAKIGPAAVIEEMCDKAGTTVEAAQRVLDATQLSGSNDEMLAALEPTLKESPVGREGVARLRELLATAAHAGIPAERVAFDPSIARGLDYYTGTIFETFLDALPDIGSVCSGGRYDNLAGLFTKERLPGVGASLGVDRLLAALEELGMLSPQQSPAPVLITLFSPELAGHALRVGRMLHRQGVAAEVFLEPRPLGKQLKYADRRGIPLAAIAGPDDVAAGVWQLKVLASGVQTAVPESELARTVASL